MPSPNLTPAQRAALQLIREHGGYASWGKYRVFPWSCAGHWGDNGFLPNFPTLNTRVMKALKSKGVLRELTGEGGGDCSFWEIMEVFDGN